MLTANKFSFNDWLNEADDDIGYSIQELILLYDYRKSRDILALVEEAFEAGYLAAYEEITK